MGAFVLAAAAAGCSGAPTSAGSTDIAAPVARAAAPLKPQWEAWRKTLSRAPLPKEGCFHGTYPSMDWQEVPCLTPPSVPMLPARPPTTNGPVQTVGNGGTNDVSATEPGTITWAEGSFPITSGFSSSQDTDYSLQLNANFFHLKNPLPQDVQVLQQFIYAPGTGVYIEYWLLDWVGDCPGGGWKRSSDQVDCYQDSTGTTGAPNEPLGNIDNLFLAASSSPDMDSVVLYTGDGNVYARGQASLLGLAYNWTAAEFNVFGNGSAKQLALPYGSKVVVQTLTAGGPSSAGAKTDASFTGESNNLSIVDGSICLINGAEPGVWFTETYPPDIASYACPPAATPAFPGAAVAAGQQVGLEDTDLFTIDQNGEITASWTIRNEPWHVPAALTGPWYPPGAPLVVTPEYGLTQTDVIAVNISHDLAVSWVVGEGTWQGPGSITSGGNYNLGSHIAASQLYGSIDPETHVFAVDTFGALTDTYIVGAGAWRTSEISAQHLFPPGAPVATSNQGLDNVTAVFVVDNWGRLNVEWQVVQGNVEGVWQGPGPIYTGNIVFAAGASIATSQHVGITETDLFVVDTSGNLQVFWWSPGEANWQGPERLTSGGKFDPLAAVSATQQSGEPETDVFLVDKNGQLNIVWSWNGGGWNWPSPIGGAYPSGASIAAVPQYGSLTPQTDVFAIDNRGFRSVSSVAGAGSWTADIGIE